MQHFSLQAVSRRRTLAALAIAIVGLFPLVALAVPPSTATGPKPPSVRIPEPSALIPVEVIRVLDPDTVLLRLDGRTLRYDLLGVSAAVSGPYGNQHKALAIDFLTRMLIDEPVLIQHDPRGERTASNRRAGYFFRGPDLQMVNLELVRLGYTRHADAFMTVHREPFAYWGAHAEQIGRGIWDEKPPAIQFEIVSDGPQEDANEPTTAPASEEGAPSSTPSGTVYITKYGKSYHREDCPHLTDTQRPAERSSVRDTHKPCKTCKPEQP